MTRPLVTFPDARMTTLAVLRASDRLTGVEFGTKPYDVEAADPPALPYAAVALDGARGQWPVVQVATIRVSVWHETEAEGEALAALVRAVLLAYSGDTDVRSFGELTGPIPTTDPDSGGPLSFFTVAARLRPITL